MIIRYKIQDGWRYILESENYNIGQTRITYIPIGTFVLDPHHQWLLRCTK